MRIGFVGTGVITKAVVTGLVRFASDCEQILLSPRNAETAAELAALDSRVRVGSSNQDVLDGSDLVCIAVLPQIVREVLDGLRFRSGHHVVTFVPGTSFAELARLVHPADQLVRAVPLPAVADGLGCTALFPPDAVVSALFSTLGDAVEVDAEDQFDALHAVTATMASFYAVLEVQADWLTRHDVPYAAARAFLSRYSVGLAHETTQTTQSFAEMIDYLSTPGGLNEQVHRELSAKGAYGYYGPALDRVFARVRNQATE